MKKLYILAAAIFFVGSVGLISKERSLTLNEKVTRALELAMYHLIDEEVITTNAVYITPVQRLRDAADMMEQKARDYDFIKSILMEWKKSQKHR